MKKLLVILMLLSSLGTTAQDGLGLAVLQDGRLLVLGDEEHGISAGTIDILVRLKMQGQQRGIGYLTIYPEFEYADLTESYTRYSLNVGYTFNQFSHRNTGFFSNLELGASIGGGITNHQGSTFSLGFYLEAAYKISDSFKVLVDVQGVQRKDLNVIWGTSNNNQVSVFYGIEYTIPGFKTPR